LPAHPLLTDHLACAPLLLDPASLISPAERDTAGDWRTRRTLAEQLPAMAAQCSAKPGASPPAPDRRPLATPRGAAVGGAAPTHAGVLGGGGEGG